MPDEDEVALDWRTLLDTIVNHADKFRTGVIPDDKADFARRHLRTANRKLWFAIDELEQRIYDAQRDTVSIIAGIAETNGEMFATRLGKLIEQGIVELNADRRRLRKAEEVT